MTDALWVTGLFGGALGGALALPLFRAGGARAAARQTWLALNLLVAATILALIGARHGALLAEGTDRWAADLVNILGFSLGPLFLGYVRALLVQPAIRGWRRTALWAPAAVYVAVRSADQPVPFLWILPVTVAFSIGGAAAWLQARRTRSAPEGALRFAGGLVACALLVNVAQAVRTFWPHVTTLREVVPMTMTAGFLVLCAWSMGHLARSGATSPAPSGDAKYARSTLRDEAAQRVLARLDELLQAERVFTRPDLGLVAVAGLLEVSPHVLSEALNRVRGVPFLQHLAALRVEEARRQLSDRANDRFTVDGIAQSCGFASRSAFYKVFRRIEGMTPTEFRRLNRP